MRLMLMMMSLVAMLIRAPAEYISEVIGFASGVDCVDGKLTEGGRVKAAAATQKLADAIGESVAADPEKELRSFLLACTTACHCTLHWYAAIPSVSRGSAPEIKRSLKSILIRNASSLKRQSSGDNT